MKLNKFEGEVVLDGVACGVAFDGSTLSIKGLGAQAANAILAGIEIITSGQGIHAAHPQHAHGTNGASREFKAAPTFIPPPPVVSASMMEVPKMEVIEPPVVEAPAPVAAEAAVVEAKPFIDEKELDADKALQPITDLPPELVKLEKLRDVVAALVDKGFSTAESLVAECNRLREHVPVLQRVGGNFDDRVRRAAAACGVG